MAIFPAVVQGGPELDYLRDGVVYLFGDAIDGVGDLRRVDPWALLGRLDREQMVRPLPDRAREIASDLGAGRVVLSSLTSVGDLIQLSGSMYDDQVGAGPTATGTATGPPEAIGNLVVDVVSQLLANQDVGPGQRLSDITTVNAPSFPALKGYLEGEALLRRGHSGRSRSAR